MVWGLPSVERHDIDYLIDDIDYLKGGAVGIIVVNPNPVFDRTISLPSLVPGTVMRTSEVEVTAGGKGVNVARVLRSLGVDSTLVLPIGRDDATRYQHLLEDEGAHFRGFEISGSVRVASIYRESDVDRVTVINDAGVACSSHEWAAFEDFVVSNISVNDVVLIMGSFPAGLSDQAAAALVERIAARGAHTLLDTAPTWLAPALAAHPDVIAPNIHEAAATLFNEDASVFDDSQLSDDQARLKALDLASACASRTDGLACVTAGSAGVACARDGDVHWVDAPEIEVVSAVGAGDSFVAGLAARWASDLASGSAWNWQAAVEFGVACAAASCEVVRAGGAERERIDALAHIISAPSMVDAAKSTTGVLR